MDNSFTLITEEWGAGEDRQKPGLLDSMEPISFFEIEIRLVSYPDTGVWMVIVTAAVAVFVGHALIDGYRTYGLTELL